MEDNKTPARILVADDEADIVSMLRGFFGGQGLFCPVGHEWGRNVKAGGAAAGSDLTGYQYAGDQWI